MGNGRLYYCLRPRGIARALTTFRHSLSFTFATTPSLVLPPRPGLPGARPFQYLLALSIRYARVSRTQHLPIY